MGKSIKFLSISFELLAIFCLPLLVKAIFGLPRLMLQNFTDGVFYLGYAMHFQELVDRVGLNYYAGRFGGIFPDALAFSLLGPVAGFSALRYGLAGAACIVLYLAFQKRFDSKVVGLFAAVAWAFNPGAIRLLQTGYVDVAGSLFLVIGVGLVVLANARRGLDFLAGVSFGLAFWSHLHAGFALFFLLPFLLLMRWSGGLKSVAESVVFWMLGGLLVTAAGVLFYGINYGLWDITSPTREYLRLLTEEGLAARWSLPWREVLGSNTFWLVPLPLLVALIFSRESGRMVWGSFLGLVGYVGFLVYGDVFQGGFSLSMFYYFSFVLAALVVFQSSLAARELKNRPRMGFAFLAALILPPLAIKFLRPEWFWMALVPIITALVFGLGFFLSERQWRSAIVVAMFALAASLVSGASSSRLALGNYWKKEEIGLLAIGDKLTNSLPMYQNDPTPLVFWYPNKDGTDAKMIQSIYLHNFMRLQNSPEDFVSFGALEPQALETLSKVGVRHIVILDESSEIIEEGIGYLDDAGVEIDRVRRFSLKEKQDVLHVGHVILKRGHFSDSRELPVEALEVQKRAFATELSDGVKITTAPVKWNFDGFLKIPTPSAGSGLRLRFEVPQGRVFVGIFKNQEPEGEICFRSFAAHPDKIETIFPAEFAAEAAYVVVRNASPNGVRSEIIIYGIDQVLPISNQ
jgi:hypothetical protein